MADEPRARALAPRLQPISDQRVLEDLVVLLDGPGRERSVASDRRGVDDPPVLRRDHVEEPGEAPQIPHHGLGLHLLPQVRLGVARQQLPGISLGAGDDGGKAAVAQRALEVEPLALLGQGQRVKAARGGPAGEEIGRAPPELARARAREQEADPVCLDQAVDLLEQRRHALDLVHEDDPRSPRGPAPPPPGESGPAPSSTAGTRRAGAGPPTTSGGAAGCGRGCSSRSGAGPGAGRNAGEAGGRSASACRQSVGHSGGEVQDPAARPASPPGPATPPPSAPRPGTSSRSRSSGPCTPRCDRPARPRAPPRGAAPRRPPSAA